jgi:hypothetical protein
MNLPGGDSPNPAFASRCWLIALQRSIGSDAPKSSGAGMLVIPAKTQGRRPAVNFFGLPEVPAKCGL